MNYLASKAERSYLFPVPKEEEIRYLLSDDYPLNNQ